MTIETTINISNVNKALLEKIASQLNTSMNVLIIKLLSRYLHNKLGSYKTFSRVSYQKKNVAEHWKCVHVWFSPEFYEMCLDLRKFHKCSLSNILAQAIDLYLDDILSDECDNYFNAYMFFDTISNNCPLFVTIWGYPGNEEAIRILKFLEQKKDTS